MQKIWRFLAIAIFFTILIGPSYAAKTPAQKTVLITGGLTGIGREMSLAFKDAGWDVWATSRNPEKYETIPGITIRKLDLTDDQAIKQIVKEIKNKAGRLDVLVNNAGYGILGPHEAISPQQARLLFETNVIAPFQLIQAALPLMRAQHSGHIINISSSSGIRALPGIGVYAASKQALEGLSEALAAETAQWNIAVSIVEPGTIKNDWVANAETADLLNQYPGYQHFTSKLRQTLGKRAEENGQKQQEVGKLVLEIANTAKPHLRYQTNSTVQAIAQEILIDPTGNLMHQKNLSFAQTLYDSKL